MSTAWTNRRYRLPRPQVCQTPPPPPTTIPFPPPYLDLICVLRYRDIFGGTLTWNQVVRAPIVAQGIPDWEYNATPMFGIERAKFLCTLTGHDIEVEVSGQFPDMAAPPVWSGTKPTSNLLVPYASGTVDVFESFFPETGTVVGAGP